MSLDIASAEYLDEYQSVNKHAKMLQEWDVQLVLLGLATTLIGLVPAVYAGGNVAATSIATSTPRAERWPFSRQNFRGFTIFVLHRLLKILLLSLLPARGSSVMKCFLVSVICDLALSTLKVANVHAIINKHPQVPLHRRVLNQSTWFDIFPAALLYSTASNLSLYLTMYAIRTLGFLDHDFSDVSRNTALYIVFATATVTYFGAMLPAYAIFIRVAASMEPLQDNANRQELGYLDIKSAWQSLHEFAFRQFIELFGGIFVIE